MIISQLFTSLLVWNVARVYAIPGSSHSKDDDEPVTTAVLATDRTIHFFQNNERQIIDKSSFELIPNLSPLTNHNDETTSATSVLEKHKPVITTVPGGENISLQYIQNFLPPQTIQDIIHSCDTRNGWTTSPQSIDGKVTAARTSRSCPLI